MQPDEKRYTLEEAKRELALRRCKDFGHDLDVVQVIVDQGGYSPVHLVCTRCDKTWKVAPDGS